MSRGGGYDQDYCGDLGDWVDRKRLEKAPVECRHEAELQSPVERFSRCAYCGTPRNLLDDVGDYVHPCVGEIGPDQLDRMQEEATNDADQLRIMHPPTHFEGLGLNQPETDHHNQLPEIVALFILAFCGFIYWLFLGRYQ